MGSSQTRARTHVPCIGRRILNNCATREAPVYGILIKPPKLRHFYTIMSLKQGKYVKFNTQQILRKCVSLFSPQRGLLRGSETITWDPMVCLTCAGCLFDDTQAYGQVWGGSASSSSVTLSKSSAPWPSTSSPGCTMGLKMLAPNNFTQVFWGLKR